MIRLRPQGEGGLLVVLGDAVDPDVNAQVHALARAVGRRLGPLVREVVPSYASLLVVFDPLRVARERLAARVTALAAEVEGVRAAPPRRVVELPVCYGGELGPDLEDVARAAALSPAEVIARHAAPVYRVYLLGFTPGFPYLGGMDPALACPRLPTPRLRVAAGSVAIAGAQTGVYPVESPGGWRIVGRTPLRLFDPSAGARRPFLLAPGDGVRFVPVERARFGTLGPPPATARAARERPGAPPARGPGASGPRGRDGPGRRALTVLRPGLLSTVQDEGRIGHRASGLPVAGAMDRLALAAANVLAGNAADAAAVELTLAGGALRFEAPGLAALAGADLSATLDGVPLPAWGSFLAPAGAVLAFGAPRVGVRAYLAVRGGISAAPVLGSRSTYARARLGGLAGRPLAAGDVLPVGRPRGPAPAPSAPGAAALPPCGGSATVRVVLGPQEDRFGEAGVAAFLSTPWRVTPANDRMGYRLDGPAVPLPTGADLLTDPVLPGAVQIANDGRPIVMMVDAQTTGGYAKIATVAGADLRLVAQARAGDVLRFAACDPADAAAALRAERAWLAGLARAARGRAIGGVTMGATTIDLNCDMGEGCGDDAALMALVSSANVACGGHAGDAASMRATVRLARRHGVTVGAHPSYPDRAGFGRTRLARTPEEVRADVAAQVRALAAACAAEGVRLVHVKPHGALYNAAAQDEALARAVALGARDVDASLVVVCLAGSPMAAVVRALGLACAEEAFADRGYTARGTLLARGEPGAVLSDPEQVAARASRMARERTVVAVDGTVVPVAADTLCLHGDTPGAARLAAAVRARLARDGVEVRALGASAPPASPSAPPGPP